MFKMGGWRSGAGRKPKLNANQRIGVAAEVTQTIEDLRQAERRRQRGADPSRAVIAEERRRIEHHADRHYDRRAALPYIEANSRKIDQLGRLWGAVHTSSYRAEAIKIVAARHNLPPRVVRDCYREFRRHVPEPEPISTVFDTLPRPEPSLVRRLAEQAYRRSFLNWIWRDSADDSSGTRDPDFANQTMRDEFANCSAKRPVGRK
jgi:hypothetical protein